MIRIALTKGRLEQEAVILFEQLGYDVSALKNKGRKLILPMGETMEVVLAKAPDVITYVARGVCDLGIVGKDTIMESQEPFYEMVDLGFGQCRFALAKPVNDDFYSGYQTKRIASKYPKVAASFFEQKGMDVEIIKIEGSVELAPLLGMVDGIVDIVETGTTLKENGLVVEQYISDLSARLIVNPASMKLKKNEIDGLVSQVEQLVKGREAK